MAGLNVYQGTGSSADNVSTLSIHGNAPLVLIDGFPRDISDITSMEIESCYVLKDAAAAALYGMRGANGVVLITTKRGISNGLKVNVDYNFGFYLTPLQNFEKGKTVFYPHGYSNYFFHPTHPHELIIVSTENNKVSILNCLSGEIVRTISKGKEYAFCNIDPVTGNYLFRNSYYVLITNENGDDLFLMRSEDASPYLANNILTCWAGAAINVEPYLKKLECCTGSHW